MSHALFGLLAAAWVSPPVVAVTLPFVALAGWRSWPKLPWGVFLGLALLLWVPSLAVGMPSGLVLTAVLAVLLVRYTLGSSGPSDDRIAVALSGLLLIVGGVDELGPWGMGCALGWAVAGPFRLLRLVSSRAPWTPVAAVLLGTALLYLGLPRAVQPLETSALVGFSGEVQLGEVGRLLDDPTEVFRVSAEGEVSAGPWYFRGLALDQFDGRTWRSSAPRLVDDTAAVGLLGGVIPEGRVRLVVTQPATAEGVLFTAGRVDRIGATASVRRDSFGARFVPADTDVRYALLTYPPLGPSWDPVLVGRLDAADRERFTELPELPEAVYELARREAGSGSDAVRTGRLATWLRANTRYTQPIRFRGRAPVVDFLLRTRAGHCEYHAAGLAVLLRAAGIPARLVNGFAGGDLDARTGERVFRRGEAHSWVEAYLEGEGGSGWALIDATPGPAATASFPEATALERATRQLDAVFAAWVTDLDGASQLAALRAVGAVVEAPFGMEQGGVAGVWGLLLLGLVGLAVSVLVAQRRLAAVAGELAEPPRTEIEALHLQARAALAGKGWRIPACLPPVAAGQWFSERYAGEGAENLERLAWLVYSERWTDERVPDTIAAARTLVDGLEAVGAPTDPVPALGKLAP